MVQMSSSAEVSASTTSSKRRQNKCKACGMLGHSQKTCKSVKEVSLSTSSSSAGPSSAKVSKSSKKSSSSKTTEKSKKKWKDGNNDSDIESCGSCGEELTPECEETGDFSDSEDEIVENINITEDDWSDIVVEELPVTLTEDGFEEVEPNFNLPTFSRRGDTGSQVQKRSGGRVITEEDYFELFFDNEIMTTFVDQTNAYAATVNSRNWTRDTDIVEFKLFLAIILYMGILRLPEIEMYWSDPLFSSHWVRESMGKTRFRELLRFWHWLDTSSMTPRQIKDKKKVDPFFTVKTFLTKLSDNFSRWYVLEQNCCIDESCFPFKGRHKCRCYNPNKPFKWHFKAFCLNSSESGYLYSFFMYQGKDEDRSAYGNCSATEYPVRKLFDPMKYPELQRKNHILCTDNWYTSVVLAIYLISIGVHLIGTCKSNKKYIPKAGIYKKSGAGKKRRGEMQSMVCNSAGESNIYFTSWMDNKPVHIVSTLPTQQTKVERVHKDGKAYVGRQDLPIPSIIKLYNSFMGYTDLFDQKLSYYVCYLKSFRWQHRIYTQFLSAAVVNAHILYAQDHDDPEDPKELRNLRLLNFTKKLINQLSVRAKPLTLTPGRKRTAEEIQENRFSGVHFSGKYLTNRGDRKYLKCRTCGEYPISTFCQQCNVGLCLPTDTETVGCFQKYHKRMYVGESSGKK